MLCVPGLRLARLRGGEVLRDGSEEVSTWGRSSLAEWGPCQGWEKGLIGTTPRSGEESA